MNERLVTSHRKSLWVRGTALWSACMLSASGAGAESSDFSWRWHLQGGANAVVERNVFWDLAEVTASSSRYDANKSWVEYYVKPGISFEHGIAAGGAIHGKFSVVSSYSQGTDAFNEGNVGATTVEEAHLGWKSRGHDALSYDVSFGPRELSLGTGMLIANGGSSGFERGALKFGPRKAWDQAFIARLGQGAASATVFHISPNELPASDGNNRMAGVDVRFDDPAGGYIGGTWLRVLDSESPHVRAADGGFGAPTILPGARRGTQALSAYARTNPIAELPDWTFTADLAYEWNQRTDLRAWAGRVQILHALTGVRGKPILSYGFQTFSGDDPRTARLERFDPLYYEGNPSAWSTGSKSSMAFINSNVQAHSMALRLQPTDVDIVTLRFSHVRANRLRSPIQFGQATRVDSSGQLSQVVAGVTHPHLADDVFVEYNRVLTRQWYLNAGAAVSFPGTGIRRITGDSTSWSGAYVNIVFNH